MKIQIKRIFSDCFKNLNDQILFITTTLQRKEGKRELRIGKPSQILKRPRCCAARGQGKGPPIAVGQISHLQDSLGSEPKTEARGDAAPSRLRRHGAGVGARARQGPPRQASLLRSLRRRHRRLRFLLFVRPGRARRRAQRSPPFFATSLRMLSNSAVA